MSLSLGGRNGAFRGVTQRTVEPAFEKKKKAGRGRKYKIGVLIENCIKGQVMCVHVCFHDFYTAQDSLPKE